MLSISSMDELVVWVMVRGPFHYVHDEAPGVIMFNGGQKVVQLDNVAYLAWSNDLIKVEKVETDPPHVFFNISSEGQAYIKHRYGSSDPEQLLIAMRI